MHACENKTMMNIDLWLLKLYINRPITVVNSYPLITLAILYRPYNDSLRVHESCLICLLEQQMTICMKSTRWYIPPILSDHSLIVASISVVTKQHTAAVSIQRRRWKSSDFDLFAGDLEQSRLVTDLPSDVADLFECYDETLR
jgi:hypothetical protein